MTCYAQLSEAFEYPRGAGQKLVLRGSRATLDDLVDHFLDDNLDGLCQAHPGISDHHVQPVVEIFADLLQDVPDERHARRQLVRQAHWALFSEQASRLIEQEADHLSDPPTPEDLLTLARRALKHLPSGAETTATQGQRSTGAGLQSAPRERAGTARSGSHDVLQQAAAELTDCSSRIRNAADRLQGDHPVHGAYARELATRLDELLVDLLPTEREG